MTERLAKLAQHLQPSKRSGIEKLSEKSPDDVVIVGAYRTALTRAGKGGFKDTGSAELLAGVLKGLLDRTKVDPSTIGDVVIGNVLNPGSGATEHRAACLVAGIPHTVPFEAINRQCGSGLSAVNDIANKIIARQIDIGIGGGSESMSQNYGPNSVGAFPQSFQSHGEAPQCLIPMGITSENVAERFHIGRTEQDEYAAASYQKAEKAQSQGLFKDEIVPLKATVVDQDENESQITVDRDDGIRPGVTAQSLGKIRPAFKKTGASHAGNSSQVTDGAAAVLLARRSVAEAAGLPVIAKFVDSRVVGVPPDIMGVGPGYAIPALLKALEISVDDVDIFEINEAFASQVLYSVHTVGIDIAKVNPKGGAIAFGHPLGATGARQIATLLPELKRTGKRVGLTSMCIGTGMGAASLIIAEY